MPAARVTPASSNYNGRRETLRNSSESRSSSECPSLQDASDEDSDIKKLDPNLTPYQKVIRKLQTDERWHQDIQLGKRIGLYRLKEELGTGNFSQVKAATHALTKERVAVKILDKSKLDSKTQAMLSREISSMESLHHPNVIRLFEVLETLSKIYLVMEHAGGGELFHKISQNGAFSEKAARPLFAQITAAVDHMHFHHIVHRDLKAENVFFSGPHTVKVGDFGFSTQVLNTCDPLKTFCGSPPYAAPELFRDDSYVGPLVDVWALGVLLYFMLTATMPFKATTVAGLKRQILEGDFLLPDHLSKDCHYLFINILKQDPQSRASLERIKNSNWLMGQKFPTALPTDELSPKTEHCIKENVIRKLFQESWNDNGVELLQKSKRLNENGVQNKELLQKNNRLSENGVHNKELLQKKSRLNEDGVQNRVKQKMADIGITEAMMEDAMMKGSRNSVTGIYRMIFHKTLSEFKTPDHTIDIPKFLKSKSSPKRYKSIKEKSKTCTIL